MKLICIKSQSLFNSSELYFIKNKIYEIIKDDDCEYVKDEEDLSGDIVLYHIFSYLYKN